MIINLADFVLEFKNQRNYPARLYKEYFFDSKKTDLEAICISKEELEKVCEDHDNYQLGLMEAFEFYKRFSEIIVPKNAFLLHAATFDIAGAGVAFSALSGTGKSTHLANWYAYLNGTADMPESLKRLLKDENLNIEKDGSLPELTIVNGDKPIIRFFDEDFCKQNNLEIPKGTEFGVPYAYGTPWCGKENLGCNMRTPLKHICFIERSDTNFVTKIDKTQAVERIMQQVYMPKDPVALSKTLELVNRLINSCELWIIHCNMEPESAEVAYKAIFG